jgi:hypothetical protein
MAVLGATTLTGCNSIPNFMDTGSVMTYIQSAAPVNWTRVATDTADNRMLRVISSGAAGGVGGSASPILNSVVPSHTHGFSTGGVSADHSHSGNTGGASADHDHQNPNYATTAQLGYPNSGSAGGGSFIGEAVIFGFGTGNLRTGGIRTNHFHGFSTGGHSVDHIHSGTTDNGSSQTNWEPRYVDSLLCSKN